MVGAWRCEGWLQSAANCSDTGSIGAGEHRDVEYKKVVEEGELCR